MIASVRLRAERFYRVYTLLLPHLFSARTHPRIKKQNKKQNCITQFCKCKKTCTKTKLLSTLEIYSWSGESKGLPAEILSRRVKFFNCTNFKIPTLGLLVMSQCYCCLWHVYGYDNLKNLQEQT